MPNPFLTNYQIDFNSDYLLCEANKRSCQPEPRSFGNVCEPEKYNAFGESTYSDHFGPKTNYPPMQPMSKEEPISTALTSCRAKHLVSTTQQDYDKRNVGTCIGTEFLIKSCQVHPCKKDIRSAPRGDPMEILITTGPVPLIQTCRRVQNFESTYQRHFQYDPYLQPNYPFPIN